MDPCQQIIVEGAESEEHPPLQFSPDSVECCTLELPPRQPLKAPGSGVSCIMWVFPVVMAPKTIEASNKKGGGGRHYCRQGTAHEGNLHKNR